MSTEDLAKPETSEAGQEETPRKAGLQWDDARMATSHANAVNVVTTVEEFMLFFGTNQSWNPDEGKDLRVELSNRIILNPHAAKRLSVMLNNVIHQYEDRFGEIKSG